MEEDLPDSHICQQNVERQNWQRNGKVQDSRIRLQGNQDCHCICLFSQGVTDAKNLVKKYLNKETVYGELLSKIADNEKVLEQLKSQTDQLIQESK